MQHNPMFSVLSLRPVHQVRYILIGCPKVQQPGPGGGMQVAAGQRTSVVLRHQNCSVLTRTLAVHVLTRASGFSLAQEGAAGEPRRKICIALYVRPS